MTTRETVPVSTGRLEKATLREEKREHAVEVTAPSLLPVSRSTATPGRTGKVLPLPTRLQAQAAEPVTGTVAVRPATTTAPVKQTSSPLKEQYEAARARIVEVFDGVGVQPTQEQIDQAIAAAVYRETPDLAVATQRLQILTQSPLTQQHYQKGGFEAASAYVNQVTVSAYQRVQTSKTKAVERNGNGRH